MSETPTSSGSLLDLVPVVPVVVIDDLDHAVPLARALVAGGLPVIELTLRTPVALDAVRAIAAEVPEITLGVGTVCTPAQAEQAAEAGAGFASRRPAQRRTSRCRTSAASAAPGSPRPTPSPPVTGPASRPSPRRLLPSADRREVAGARPRGRWRTVVRPRRGPGR